MEVEAIEPKSAPIGFSRKPPRPPTAAAGAHAAAFVPTAFWPLVAAIFVLVVIQHVIVFSSEIVIWTPTAPDAFPRGARGISAQFANDATQRIITASMLRAASWRALFCGLFYIAIAHFALRWLGFVSIAAYTIAGLCAAFAVAAYWSVLGSRLQWDTFAMDLACGAIAGLVYRLLAGKKRMNAPPVAPVA